METVYITEEELDYYTNNLETLNESNDETYGFLTDEEWERESQGCITLEEFSDMIGEAIKRKFQTHDNN